MPPPLPTMLPRPGALSTNTPIDQLARALDALARIEGKLDALIDALADEDEDEPEKPARDLQGEPMPRERDQDQPL